MSANGAKVNAQEAVFLMRPAEFLELGADPQLTETGKRQAESLAKLLKDTGIGAIYAANNVSPPAKQTAEPLAKTLNIKINIRSRDTGGLIQRLRTKHVNDRVLIVTGVREVGWILEAFGHPKEAWKLRTDHLFLVIPRSNSESVALTPIRKNNRGISGVDHDMTAVTDILIFGLQLY